MAAVESPDPPPTGPPDGSPAAKLLNMLPEVPDNGFIPGPWGGMPGGADITRPHDLVAEAVLGGIWPPASPSALHRVAGGMQAAAERHAAANSAAHKTATNTFDRYWPTGAGSHGAQQFFGTQTVKHDAVIDFLQVGGGQVHQVGNDTSRTQRVMYEAYLDALAVVRAHLQNHSGVGVINIPALAAPYRARAMTASVDLHSDIASVNAALAGHGLAPQTPAPKSSDDGSDRHTPDPPDGSQSDKDGVVSAVADSRHGAPPVGNPAGSVSAMDGRHGEPPMPASPPSGVSWTGGKDGHLPGLSIPPMQSTGAAGAGSPLSSLMGFGSLPGGSGFSPTCSYTYAWSVAAEAWETWGSRVPNVADTLGCVDTLERDIRGNHFRVEPRPKLVCRDHMEQAERQVGGPRCAHRD